MTLFKWTPRQSTMINGVDNTISSMFNDDWNSLRINKATWNPAIDVQERDEIYVINADIPGLTKSDVKINISNGVLSISGERMLESDKEKDHYHYRERTVGSFNRSFNLPDTVDDDKITANCKNGILTIRLPKIEATIPKEREIKIN